MYYSNYKIGRVTVQPLGEQVQNGPTSYLEKRQGSQVFKRVPEILKCPPILCFMLYGWHAHHSAGPNSLKVAPSSSVTHTTGPVHLGMFGYHHNRPSNSAVVFRPVVYPSKGTHPWNSRYGEMHRWLLGSRNLTVLLVTLFECHHKQVHHSCPQLLNCYRGQFSLQMRPQECYSVHIHVVKRMNGRWPFICIVAPMNIVRYIFV